MLLKEGVDTENNILIWFHLIQNDSLMKIKERQGTEGAHLLLEPQK